MIDYDKILKESEKMGISPHLLVKRKINYRKALNKSICCRECQVYESDNNICDVIGFNLGDIHCFIDPDNVCDKIKLKEVKDE